MNHRTVTLTAASLLAAGALAACSDDAPTAANLSGAPVVKVTMTDMAFSPSTISVQAGQTIRFQFHNSGAAIHEAVFGDEADQEHHAEEMAAMADESMGSMAHSDDDEAPLVVAPGAAGETTYIAETTGTLVIGCHQPGHWEAGMRATLDVTA
jgi:uncharacterized cupredoxin-like copper-binding protein